MGRPVIAAACIVVFALILLCALETAGWAFLVGRYKRARGYTDWTLSQPPVPDTDSDWLSVPPLVFPADVTLEEIERYAAEVETAAYRAEFAAIVCEQFPYDAKRFQS